MKFVYCFLFLILIATFPILSSAQDPDATQTAQNDAVPLADETPTPTETAVSGGVLYTYTFSGDDPPADAIVKLTLRDKCTVKITRIKKAKNVIDNLCSTNAWLNPGDAIEEPSRPAGASQYSIYSFNASTPCADEVFPAHIEIINFGSVKNTGNPKAWRLRMIHEDGAGNCKDITTNVWADIDPTKDGKGSGDETGFSNFLLTHVPTSKLKTVQRVKDKFNVLIGDTTAINRPDLLQLVEDALEDFENKDYTDAANTLRLFDFFVEEGRKEIGVKPSANLQKQARWIIYDVRQFKHY